MRGVLSSSVEHVFAVCPHFSHREPDTDGLCEGMQRSTTLLVERNAEGDVSLSDYHFIRRDAAPIVGLAESENGVTNRG